MSTPRYTPPARSTAEYSLLAAIIFCCCSGVNAIMWMSWVVARSKIELVPGPTDQTPTSMVPSLNALALSVKDRRLSLYESSGIPSALNTVSAMKFVPLPGLPLLILRPFTCSMSVIPDFFKVTTCSRLGYMMAMDRMSCFLPLNFDKPLKPATATSPITSPMTVSPLWANFTFSTLAPVTSATARTSFTYLVQISATPPPYG